MFTSDLMQGDHRSRIAVFDADATLLRRCSIVLCVSGRYRHTCVRVPRDARACAERRPARADLAAPIDIVYYRTIRVYVRDNLPLF